MLLKALGELLEAWDNTKKEDHTKGEKHTEEEVHTDEDHTKEEELSGRSDREIIKDVLIWRCILIYLLFSTAPDNSKVLTSGSWEQVVPIIKPETIVFPISKVSYSVDPVHGRS